jgi:hypothetical protein
VGKDLRGGKNAMTTIAAVVIDSEATAGNRTRDEGGAKIEGMDELSNPDLIRAIQEMVATDGPTSRAKVLRALSMSTLIVPFWGDATALLSPPQPLLVAIGDSTEPCLVAFTDWEAVGRWSNRAAPKSYADLMARGVFMLADRLRVRDVWINLGSPPSLRVNRAAIAILARGELPTGLEPDESDAPT